MKRISALLLTALTLTGLLLLGGCGKSQAPEPQQEEGAIQIETVETDGFAMDYFRFGRGERTLVILPGLSVQSVMGSAEAVAEAYAPLTDEFTIYLFDRRKDLPETYTTQEMAGDTAAAIRALGLEKVSLFGASQGGMMALEIAIRDPELTDRLVLGSTAPWVTDTLAGTLDTWIGLAEAGDAEGLYLAFGQAVYPEEVFQQSRDLLVQAAQTVTEEDLSRFVILARAMEGFDVRDQLDRIACPVLALGAEDDRVLGAEGTRTLADLLGSRPDFEVYLYDGYGHAAYDLAPDYKDRMLAFLVPESAGEAKQ